MKIMSISQNYDWSENIIIDNKVFPADQLDRAKYAKYLTSYLSSFKNERHFVLNINSGWGTGKTHFIKRWHHEIKQQYPAVYVDAWKQDFSDDPLLATVSAIILQLREQCGKNEDTISTRSLAKALGLFKIAAPILTKAMIKKATGIATDELIDTLASDNEKTAPTDIGQSDIAAKFVESLLKDHEKKLQSIEHFKQTIQEWVKAVVGLDQLHSPAFIFIDELDRCRPSYAVEMLEMIKHLFSMKGIVFVVSTDTAQLQHSIKVVYGQDFDAETYLGRFFNRRVTFKIMPRKKLIMSSESFISLYSNIENNLCIWPYYQSRESIAAALGEIFDVFEINPRDVDRVLDQLQSLVAQSFAKKVVDILFCANLLCLRQNDAKLFDLIKSEEVSWPPSDEQITQYKLKILPIFKDNREISLETFKDSYYRFIISNTHKGNLETLEINLMNLLKQRLGKGYNLGLMLGNRHNRQAEKPNYLTVTLPNYAFASKDDYFELITMAGMLDSSPEIT
jgi:hypothetical protein